MGFIKSGDGTRLFYQDWGTGRPVVLVHGLYITHARRLAADLVGFINAG